MMLGSVKRLGHLQMHQLWAASTQLLSLLTNLSRQYKDFDFHKVQGPE